MAPFEGASRAAQAAGELRPTHPACGRERAEIVLFQRIETVAGAELSMFRVVEDLLKRGLTFRAAFYGTGARFAAETYPFLNAEIIPVTRTRNVIAPLARLLRREQPRLLLSALTMTNCAAVAAARLAGTSTRVRVIQTEHNPVVARFRHGGLRRAAYLRLLRTSYQAADAVVAVSAGVAQEIAAITNGKVRPRVIYNPAVDKGPPPCSAPPHPWLRPGEPPCIMSMGRLRPEKGHAALIEAFAELARATPCRLIILGEGSERSRLEESRDRLGLGDRVLLPGFASIPSDWLHYAALYVCSSVYEGFGNAIVEAMECGLPVVSTDCPFGPSEILENGKYGRLVPVGRSDLLASAMSASLNEPAEKDRLRARAAMFSRARAVDDYARLIAEFA